MFGREDCGAPLLNCPIIWRSTLTFRLDCELRDFGDSLCSDWPLLVTGNLGSLLTERGCDWYRWIFCCWLARTAWTEFGTKNVGSAATELLDSTFFSYLRVNGGGAFLFFLCDDGIFSFDMSSYAGVIGMLETCESLARPSLMRTRLSLLFLADN